VTLALLSPDLAGKGIVAWLGSMLVSLARSWNVPGAAFCGGLAVVVLVASLPPAALRKAGRVRPSRWLVLWGTALILAASLVALPASWALFGRRASPALSALLTLAPAAGFAASVWLPSSIGVFSRSARAATGAAPAAADGARLLPLLESVSGRHAMARSRKRTLAVVGAALVGFLLDVLVVCVAAA
jgi:hypothetical protein